MTTLLAGFIGGALMGLIFVTHASLVLVFRTPVGLARRAAEGTVIGMVMAGTVGGLVVWSLLGVAAAILFRATETEQSLSVGAVPNTLYLIILLFVAAIATIPAALFMRNRLRHLATEFALFIGIFGWLIPAMVKAF
ncbi:MAG: hypothetical protein EXR44_08470 [Dehalococcoidia bacterium]|nr:hypothetical protein [Dehalococcoidia bacterium]